MIDATLTIAPRAGREHGARSGARAQETAGQVDVDHLLPVVLRQLDRRPAQRDAGVVDEDVDPTAPLRDLGEYAVDRGAVGDVEQIGTMLDAVLGERGAARRRASHGRG